MLKAIRPDRRRLHVPRIDPERRLPVFRRTQPRAPAGKLATVIPVKATAQDGADHVRIIVGPGAKTGSAGAFPSRAGPRAPKSSRLARAPRFGAGVERRVEVRLEGIDAWNHLHIRGGGRSRDDFCQGSYCDC